MSSPIGHTHPPQEDIKLKPNPVYGVSTGEEMCCISLTMKPWALQPEASAIMSSPTDQAPPIDLKPNSGYGISVPQESQTALDHIHKASGTATDVYDYVLD